MAVSLKKQPQGDTYRVVTVHDSGHRVTEARGMTLAAATILAATLEAETTTTARDVRVEEE